MGNNMKKLDINITKAQLTNFSVDLEDGKPIVSVTVALLTEGGKTVTTYSADTRTWRTDPLQLPIAAMPLIGDLARLLEGVAVNHCRDSQLALPAKTSVPKTEKEFDDEITIPERTVKLTPVTHKDDDIIDLSDIPF